MSKGRTPPPPPVPAASDTVCPVWSVAELAAFMARQIGLFHLCYLHDDDCPADHAGRGCSCAPTVYLRDHEWRIVAEVQP